MPPPNAMMAALQQSRGANPAPSGGPPAPGGMPPMPTGDPAQAEAIAKLSSGIQDITAKLDKLIEAISGQYTGKAEGSEPVEDDEKGAESGEANTFK